MFWDACFLMQARIRLFTCEAEARVSHMKAMAAFLSQPCDTPCSRVGICCPRLVLLPCFHSSVVTSHRSGLTETNSLQLHDTDR